MRYVAARRLVYWGLAGAVAAFGVLALPRLWLPLVALLWLWLDNWRLGLRATLAGAAAAALGLAICAFMFAPYFISDMLFPRTYHLARALSTLGRLQFILPAMVLWAVWAWHERRSKAARSRRIAAERGRATAGRTQRAWAMSRAEISVCRWARARLAFLRETQFHKIQETRYVAEGQLCAFAGQAEGDEGRGDFRWGGECFPRNFEDKLGARVELGDDGKVAVIARTRSRGRPSSSTASRAMASLGVATCAASRARRRSAREKWRARAASCVSGKRTVDRSWMVTTTGPRKRGAAWLVS